LTLFALALIAPAAGGSEGAGDPLPRRGLFGARVATLPSDTRRSQKVAEGVGVLVEAVFPGSTAAEMGLERGDVVTAVGEAPAKAPVQFVGLFAVRNVGDRVEVTFVRDGTPRTRSAALKPRPLESSDAYDVVYGSVESRGKRLRTILTRPRGAGKALPSLFVIQGIGAYSVESLAPGQGTYARFTDAFTRHGYVTFRVDKPGQGDSEGGPTRDVDFATELDGYRQALKALKAADGVDPERVVILGHSMGGVMGPLIAAENPVRGVAAYGTVAKTWHEYILENNRRQQTLAGDDPATIDRQLRRDAAILHLVNVDGLSFREVAEKYPDLKGRVEETTEGGQYYGGRNVEFFRQLAAMNLPEAWAKFPGHALAAWGQADFVSSESDHALIAAVVNRVRPGKGTFLAVPESDHGFRRAASQEESFERSSSPGGDAAAEFNPAFLDALLAWADRITRSGKPE
jgi:dienelactone hydrolase